MKVTNKFTETIKEYLDKYANENFSFNECYQKTTKSIDSACNYILKIVQDSKISGYADQEIFDMAIKYYEDDSIINDDKDISCEVVHNTTDSSPRIKENNSMINPVIPRSIPTPVKAATPSLFD